MTTRPLLKVCGITREADARLCAELGADLLGFIFHPKSPRRVEAAFPAGLDLPGVRPLRPLRPLKKVGLFVLQDAQATLELMDAGRLDLAQLHGGQDEALCERLARALGPERLIKVLWPERAASLEDFQADIDRFAPLCGLFLADAGGSGGGHGRPMTEAAAAILARARFPRPWLLAGGLSPANAARLFQRFRPDGLDFNSGVESAPGHKDETLLRAALAAVDAAQASEVLP